VKFAVVEGERREAEPGLSAACPACGTAMIAKCGDIKVRHWAHRGRRICDHWWEPETAWHRDWKNHFPTSWQERLHSSENGEKHIADVKTGRGVVLEFQHSFLHSDERESREKFYPKLVWVVDALRRKGDRKQFFASLGSRKRANVPIYSIPIIDGNYPPSMIEGGALLRDWGACSVPVYFDFGTDEMGDAPNLDTTALWLLVPRKGDRAAYLLPVPRTEFVRIHLAGEPFEEQCADLVEQVKDYFRQRALGQPRGVGFERYMPRGKRPRRF